MIENKKTVMRIRFRGAEYVFVGRDLAAGGAIATAEDFANFNPSFAHLYPDGRILHLHEQIGSREDIEVLGECEVEISTETEARAISHIIGLLDDLEEGRPVRAWMRRE